MGYENDENKFKKQIKQLLLHRRSRTPQKQNVTDNKTFSSHTRKKATRKQNNNFFIFQHRKTSETIDCKIHRGGPLWCTGFRRVFRSRKWGRQIGQKLNVETGSRSKKIREDTSRHPKPISHPQTRQDPVVGVFLRWSHPIDIWFRV